MLQRFAIKLTTVQFILCAALFFTTIGNLPLWQQVGLFITPNNSHAVFFALSLPLFVFCLFNILFSLLTWPYLRKPFFVILLMISAGCSYFMLNYHVAIDRGMIQNFFETDRIELFSYFSPSLLLYLLALGVAPTLMILCVRFQKKENVWGSVLSWCGNIALSLLILMSIASFFYKDYASLLRNHRSLAQTILPINYLKNTYSYLNHRYGALSQPLVPVGEDATRPAVVAGVRSKLLVLVIGETARAKNFSLNGYDRPTNPRLSARHDVLAFQNVISCGTATAVSLPCMFSRMPRENFKEDRAIREENLVDILQRTGVKLLWRENNNGGCKGLCNRVPNENMPSLKISEFCKNLDGTCYDDILLSGLDEKIRAMQGDAVIVLHQLGSHGPTYFSRYPESEKYFTPTCDTNQIQNCSTEALVNTYDNTLLYTDKMLDETIELLNRYSESRDVGMIYLSDHGESLGEKGFYLHGAPYLIAPDEQNHIPMVMWFSPEFARDTGFNLSCLQQNAQRESYSQDNLFHSVLGLFSVNTHEYQKALDLFAACRQPSASSKLADASR